MYQFDYDDDYERDELEDYYEYEYDDEEPTWLYQWRGHFFYDKPTLKQKVMAVWHDIIFRVKCWFSDDDIPF